MTKHEFQPRRRDRKCKVLVGGRKTGLRSCGEPENAPCHELPVSDSASEKLHVLCLNDWSIGVYSTEAAAEAASEEDWRKREPNAGADMKTGDAKLGFGDKAFVYRKHHYHSHEFVVDAEAKL